jgi:hypothetical protein
MTLAAPERGDDTTKSSPKSEADAANSNQAAPPTTNSEVIRGLHVPEATIGGARLPSSGTRLS